MGRGPDRCRVLVVEDNPNLARMATLLLELYGLNVATLSRGRPVVEKEVHAKSIQDKRPVVIIHDEADDIDLPDTVQPKEGFHDRRAKKLVGV